MNLVSLAEPIKAAQATLKLSSPNLVVDGFWGTFTNAAYNNAPLEVKTRAQAILKAMGAPDPASLAAAHKAAKAQNTPSYAKAKLTARAVRSNVAFNQPRTYQVSGSNEIKRQITMIAAEEGVPAELALKVAYLESKFDPMAVSKTGHKGLFQIGTYAATDVRDFDPTGIEFVRASGTGYGGKPLYKLANPFDVVQNIKAGVRYLKVAKRYLGVDWSRGADIYMAFNIGATAAKHVLRGEPEKAREEIKNQYYGNGDPQRYYAALSTAYSKA